MNTENFTSSYLIAIPCIHFSLSAIKTCLLIRSANEHERYEKAFFMKNIHFGTTSDELNANFRPTYHFFERLHGLFLSHKIKFC